MGRGRSKAFWGCSTVLLLLVTILGTLIVAFFLNFRHVPDDFFDPKPPTTALGARYRAMGIVLESRPSLWGSWADDSHWTDGFSHNPPHLPLKPGDSISNRLTCTQAETLLLATFPIYAAPKLSLEEIGDLWIADFTEALWGEQDRGSLERIEQGRGFFDYCRTLTFD